MGGRDACVYRRRRGVTGGRVLPKQGLRGAGGVALRFGERRSLGRDAASIARSIADNVGGGAPPTPDTILISGPSIPNTTTTITNSNSNNNNNISISNKNLKKHVAASLPTTSTDISDLTPAVLSLAGHFPGNTKALRGRISPTQGLNGGGAAASIGVLTPSRDDGGGSVRATDCTWDDLRGAISAPKSGASRWTQNDLMAALTLVKAGTPIKPAAERCNIPVMTLWRRTRALGIVSSKVQCGFRYPAARRRPKTDQDSNPHVKAEAELTIPVKAETDALTTQKTEVDAASKGEGALVGCPSGSWTTVSTTRAGPLREMTVHAPRRLTSRESSPRPAGRENSPLPAGRTGISRPLPTHAALIVKKNRTTVSDENTASTDSFPSLPPTSEKDSPAAEEPQPADLEVVAKSGSDANSSGGHDAVRGPAAKTKAGSVLHAPRHLCPLTPPRLAHSRPTPHSQGSSHAPSASLVPLPSQSVPRRPDPHLQTPPSPPVEL
ncbi:hypothetical protein E2C01_058210 [Portunus trituberculatus]|uniref:HTH psq-type domain-containing protein n=1 Tax=Portunus trituberculatus TaxID=210409 RepID=A0A5B7GVT1_PORTR|nr:hypothetical protein [Portunus trituberculatus]